MKKDWISIIFIIVSLKQLSKAYQGFLYKFSYALALALSKSLFRDGKVIINNIYVPHGAETKFHSQSWKPVVLTIMCSSVKFSLSLLEERKAKAKD